MSGAVAERGRKSCQKEQRSGWWKNQMLLSHLKVHGQRDVYIFYMYWQNASRWP